MYTLSNNSYSFPLEKLAVNQVIRFIYISLITIPLIYLIIAGYSYCAVLFSFGRVFGLSEESINFEIFPAAYGKIVIVVLLVSMIFVTPGVILLNLVLRIVSDEVVFPRPYVILAFVINAIAYILVDATEFGGWYMSYVLD